jgi:WD40 repeat protein
MILRCLASASLLLLLSGTPAPTQQPAPRVFEKEPLLRVDAAGPTASVTALAFSPDGQTLYTAGYDKVVRTWTLPKDGKQFQPGGTTYRVPIGPGYDGTIAALAVSPDGKRLAVGGMGLVAGRAGFGKPGQVIPKIGGLSDDMRLDQGTIWIFDTDKGTAWPLRGHRGLVQALAFAPPRKDKPAVLASLGAEWDGKAYVSGVRLWDVAARKELASRQDLPYHEGGKPSLTTWHTGDDPLHVRVALALQDGDVRDGKIHPGQLRLWDVQAKELWQPADAVYNNTVASILDPAAPEKARVITGSFTGKHGQLRVWEVSGTQPVVKETIALPAGHVPRALAVLAGKAENRPDHVAVVVRIVTAGKDPPKYQLHVFELGNGTEKARVNLWDGAGLPMPVVAAGKGHLAVSGSKDHRIHVFSIPELLTKGNAAKPLHDLRSTGAALNSVAFVKKGDALGLRLSETAGELVFDLSKAVLTTYQRNDWSLSAPAMGTWTTGLSVTRDDQGGIRRRWVSVYRDGKELGWVGFSRDQERTSHALLPQGPSSPFPMPLLAIAHYERGETVLALYNGLTGEMLRQLSGHVIPIRSLAFSADGRLLASVAEDQTVCVWSLTDLHQHLGQRGRVAGLAVQNKGADLLVAELKDEELHADNRKEIKAKGVRVDDVIEAIVEKEQRRPLATPWAFYDAVWPREPKQHVVLRIKGRGDVRLVVSQGIDERKPLLSLFVTQGDKPQARQWIGWSPVGPYDFGGPNAERLLGWHRNTGQDEKPVSYDVADESRKLHHKPGILQDLIAKGNTGQALDAWHQRIKPREPEMTLWLQEAGPSPPLDEKGRVVVRQLPRTLVLTLQELHPAVRLGSVRWLLDGADRGSLKKDEDSDWTADLTSVAWKRGEYILRVELETEAPERRTYVKQLAVRYQPPRPSVRAREAPPPFVSEAKYTLKAEVKPGDGQEVQVRLLHRYRDPTTKKDEEKAIAAFAVKETRPIAETVQLQPGKNVLRLIAENKDAPAGDDAERDYLTLETIYQTPAPSITLTKLVLSDGEMIALDPGRRDVPIAVATTAFQIIGAIEAQTDLVEPAWAVGDAKPESLRLGADKKKLTLDQKVRLTEPNKPLKIRFQARTESSKEVEEGYATVVYRPRLPRAEPAAPAENQYADKVAVTCQLFWPRDPRDRHACRASLVVNGKEQAAGARDLKPGEAAFTAQAALEPGENWVQVKLTYAWDETLTEKQRVRYLRPPRIVRPFAHALDTTGKSYIKLAVQVESAADLPVTRLEVNGRELPEGAFHKEAAEQKGNATVWKVTVPDVPIQPGANPITVRVSNADGWSKAESQKLLVEAKQLRKAKVIFRDPQRDVPVEDPEYRVHFRIESVSPLRKVELRRGDEVVKQWDAAELKGRFELEAEKIRVPLRQGSNSLRLVAQNDGGEEAPPPVVVTYHYRPARIVIDKLVYPDRQEVLPRPGTAGGVLTFDAAPQATVRLHGEVIYDRDPEQLAKLDSLWLNVNGPQQFPVRLDAPGKDLLKRTFKAEIRLTRKEGNDIELRLPGGLVHEAGSRRKCRLDCLQPAEPVFRRPHLLLVDTGPVDPDELLKRHLDRLGAKPKGPRGFTLEGYTEDGIVYGPLTGTYATPEKVNGALRKIELDLKREARDGSVNDVVLIYFRAGETVAADGHVFHAPDGAPGSAGIDCQRLQSFFARSVGCGVWFLDVNRQAAALPPPVLAPSGDRVAGWQGYPHVAVIRLTWWDQPARQADSARLVAYLGEALGKSRLLPDVAAYLAGKFNAEPPHASLDPALKDRLTFDQHVPAALRDLLLGRPKP